MDNMTIYQPQQRDSFGQYQILPGHVHSFAFTVPMFGGTSVEIAHILPNSQDFSLDFWISEQPLDGLVLAQGFGHNKAKRRAERFDFMSSYLRADDNDTRLFLNPSKTYYLNAKNLQNRANAYELNFSELTQPPPP